MYYSQSKQDEWVGTLYRKGRNGFFLDVGAYDGVQTSNTLFLEKELGWTGICIEANEEVFQNLCLNRSSKNILMAVTSYRGECSFSETLITPNGKLIPCDTLDNILTASGCPSLIHYLSIDIEGAEMAALKGFPFDKWNIGAITVEHNSYLDGPTKKNALFDLLSKNGFERVVNDAKCLDPYPAWYMKPYEDWYVNRDFQQFTL